VFVCHRCDNKLCVEPSHLFAGTHKDNMADMCAKGRQARGHEHSRLLLARAARGERHGMAKLDDGMVRRLRALRREGRFQREIAAELGVSRSLVSMVLGGKLWREVQP
jgi:hypothetical protein